MPAPINPTMDEQITPDGLPIAQPNQPAAAAIPAPAAAAAPKSIAELPVANPNQEIQATTNKPIADDETVDLGDFMAIHKKAVDAEPAPAPKPADPKAATPPPAPPAKPAAAAPAPAPDPKARDYSGIPDDVKPLFERMSNEAFAKMKEVWNENVQAKEVKTKLEADLAKAKEGSLPDSYYEHEDAYMLTPEFANASILINQSQIVLNHWREQARKIAGGADTYQKLMRDANGNFVLSAPIAADRNTPDQLDAIIDGSQKQLIKFQTNIETLGATHKAKYSEAKNWLTNWEKQAFTIFEDDTKPFKAMARDSLAKFLPAAFHNNPLAGPLIKALVTIRGLTQQAPVAGAQAAPGGAPAPAPSKQPTAAEIAGGGAAPAAKPAADEDVTMDDFNAAKMAMQ